MNKKKVLTVEDLILCCKTNGFTHFNATESGYQICVHTPGVFKKDAEEDLSNEKALVKDALLFHTGRNFNGSNVTEEAAKKAMKTLAYVPVLANFCEINGVRDFTSHDFEFDDDGNPIYYEHQIGCITADEAYMEDDEKVEGRKNVFAKVSIPRCYTDAAEIIERKGGTDVSVEMAINDMSYSKEDGLLLNDVEIMGLTCLGTDPDTGRKVNPGMENARISLEDFSMEKNSVINKSELVTEITQSVMANLKDYFSSTMSGKEDDAMKKEFDNEDENKEQETVMSEESNINEEEEAGIEETTETTEEESAEENSDESNEEAHEEEKQSESVAKFVKSFEMSHEDIRCGLYELLRQYEEADNEWYYIEEVYDEYFVYSGWFDVSHLYKQGYSVEDDVVHLEGERVHMNRVLLTDSEYAEVNEMRSNYSSIKEKLAKYEAEPEKISLLSSSDYALIENEQPFIDLKKQENHFDLTVKELKDKADELLLAFAKKGNLKTMNFALNEKPEQKEEKKEEGKDFFAFARFERTSFLDDLLKNN